MDRETVIHAIDTAPLNRGLSGRAWIENPANVAIIVGDDIALFDGEAPGVFQMHVVFKSRGRSAVKAAREAIRRIFEEYGASTIFGMVPEFRRDVKLLARWAGMRRAGKRATADGICDLFVISKEMLAGN